MFQEHNLTVESDELIERFAADPTFQPIIASLTISRRGLLSDDVTHYLTSCKTSSNEYWIYLRTFGNRCHLFLASTVDVTHNDRDFENFFRDHISRHEGFRKVREFRNLMSWGTTEIIFKAEKVLLGLGFQQTDGTESYHFVRRLDCSRGLKSYESYDADHERFVCQRMSEEDIELVAKTWTHKSGNEADYVRKRLNALPCVVVKNLKNRTAAFAMTEFNGMIVHIYVLPDFRGLGIRKIVLDEICLRIRAEIGTDPYYCVVKTNDSMLRGRIKEDQIFQEDGTPLIVHFRMYIC